MHLEGGARACPACSISSRTKMSERGQHAPRVPTGGRRYHDPAAAATRSGTTGRSSPSWLRRPTRPRAMRRTASASTMTRRRRAATFGSEGARRQGLDGTTGAGGPRGSEGRRRRGRVRGGPREDRRGYATPTQHHNPMELFTTTCVWQGDTLAVHEPSQFVNGLSASAVAQQLGIDRRRRCAWSVASCRRRLRLQGHADAAHRAHRHRGQAARPAGQAGGDARPGLHHRAPIAPRRASTSSWPRVATAS